MSDGDVLSQAEVENLLAAMTGGEAPVEQVSEPAAAEQPTAEPEEDRSAQRRERIVPYDFKRPERLGKEQMRALQTLHEAFARNFAASLSATLRSIVHVKLTSVDELPYSEFVFSMENPTCVNILKAEPLEGNLVLDLNPSILYPIIDRLLGGGQESSPLTRRPLTEIESRLVGRITSLFLRQLEIAWLNALELQCEVVRVESNPQLVQIVPPNEAVVLVSFELTLVDDTRGMANLCIPYNAIERISGNLSANQWVAATRREVPPEAADQIGRVVRGSLVDLAVRLARTRITTSELLSLRVGDIITTEKDVRSPLLVTVEDVPKFRATAGAFKAHKAIQIESMLESRAEAIGE